VADSPSAQDSAPLVIVGAGFGGLTTALALAQLPDHPPLLLIEPNDRFLFLPLLYELLSGELRRWEIAPAYNELLAGRGVAWLRSRVVSVDAEAHSLRTADGQQLTYSQLVIATGGRPESFGIPGVEENALGFRNLHDVDRLQQLVEQLRQRPRPLQRLVVVGAGASGVELACKLADMLDGAAVLELIEQGPELLPNSKAFNREQARLALQRRDIRLRTGTRVVAVQPNGLDLLRGDGTPSGQEHLSADGVIWTAGVAACVPAISPPLPLDRRGRLPCHSDLRVEGLRDVFALGDAAGFPSPDDPTIANPLPATAQVAYQQAELLAGNLRKALAGEPLEAFHWNDLGEMLGLGIGQASITGMGLTLAGPAAHQIRRLGYLARLPGLGHQLKVAAGWLADWR